MRVSLQEGGVVVQRACGRLAEGGASLTKPGQGRSAPEVEMLKVLQNLPGGPMVKNPPDNAGDTGSVPGPGRSHVLRGNEVHTLQQRSQRNEQPRTTPGEEPPLAAAREGPWAAVKTQHSQNK